MAKRIGKLRREPLFVLVVEEVLLELIEDDVDVSVRCIDGALEGVADRPFVQTDPRGLVDCVSNGNSWLSGPRRRNDDGCVRHLVERSRNPGSQQGRLADAARPVEDGETRSHEVRDHDFALTLTAEEEQCIEIRVSERHEPLERTLRWGDDDVQEITPATSASACRDSAVT